MIRLAAVLGVLVLVLAVGLMPAVASDDDAGRSGSVAGGSDDDFDDDDDDREDDDDDDRDRDDDDFDDDDDDDDDDDSGRHRRRHRHRNRGGAGDRSNDEATSSAGGSGDATAPSSGPALSAATVRVNDRSFAPQTISVAVGGTVTWNNVSRDHTVTGDDGSFDSGVFDAGQDFRHTFATAGSFDYRCLIHPEMIGTVAVGDGSGGAQGSSSDAAPPSSSSSQRSATTPRGGSSGQPGLGNPVVPPPLAAAASETADVEVRDFEFAPADLEVAPGTTVRWTLTGEAPHTVTSEGFDSGMLMAGDSYEQTFTEEGTVAYRCDLHPEMTGTVAVGQNAAASAGTTGAGGGASGGGAEDASGAVATSALANTGLRGVVIALLALAVLAGGTAAVMLTRRRSRAAR